MQVFNSTSISVMLISMRLSEHMQLIPFANHFYDFNVDAWFCMAGQLDRTPYLLKVILAVWNTSLFPTLPASGKCIRGCYGVLGGLV